MVAGGIDERFISLANDPNESELHSLLWPAIGRDEDQPMFVISQKTLTGHSKAGAALFQTGGIIDVFRTHRIPANVSLDCVDPLIVYAHPGVFEQAVAQQRGADAATSWRERAEQRLRAGRAHFEAGMLGRAPLFEIIEGRRLPAHNAKAAEIAMLLDDTARLGEDGTYPQN